MMHRSSLKSSVAMKSKCMVRCDEDRLHRSFYPRRIDAVLLCNLHDSLYLFMHFRYVAYHFSRLCRSLCRSCDSYSLKFSRRRVSRRPKLSKKFICSRLTCSHLSEQPIRDVILKPLACPNTFFTIVYLLFLDLTSRRVVTF